MNEPQNLLDRALQLHQSGQVQAALELYNRVLPSQPGNAQLLYLAGTANLQVGQMEQGIECIRRSLAISPDNPAAHNNIGRALQVLGRGDEALASYDQALALRPDHAEAWYNRGVAPQALGRSDEALASYDRALALKPDFAEACNDRGIALQSLMRWDEALASCDRALAIRPDYAEVHYNRGGALHELTRLDEALASYDKALVLKPDYAEAHNNRGVALHELMRLDEALTSFDQALAAKPDFARAWCNKSYVLLHMGNFEGWELLEWRFKMVKSQFSQPHWLGEEKLEGKTILLHAEEGIGDAVQFCRYAKTLHGLGAKVFLEVQRPLVGLLQGLEGVSGVIERGQARPAFDYHCPLLSLPWALRDTLTSIPYPTPYLHADEAKTRYWQTRIGSGRKLKVGIAWSGGLRPGKPEWRVVNERRNIPLGDFCRALNGVDAEFFSLQKGEEAEGELRLRQLEYWPRRNFHNFMDENRDFSDTAAIMANMDVIISVCTSTAHVAAALGKPTWVLLKFDADWRWLLDRDDSPWYQSVKLYRQSEDRRWEPVLRRVAADLARLADSSGTRP